MNDVPSDKIYRILCLDGGGAKGFYTLGVLKEIEALVGEPLHNKFDLIFGTSTGAIIAALIGLGVSIDEVLKLYKEHVVAIMALRLPGSKSRALRKLSSEVFKDDDFTAFKTGIGIIATRWSFERPMIFKNQFLRAHAGKGTFEPGFGCKIGDAVEASCSAYPFFKKKIIRTSGHEEIVLVDGGYCANNPTLYAIADATEALKIPRSQIRVVSIGVGEYPSPRPRIGSVRRWIGYFFTVRLLQKVMEINTQSMDQLRAILFDQVPTIRISEAYTQPEMATDMFEHNLEKLDLLWQRGRQSFRKWEKNLAEFLL